MLNRIQIIGRLGQDPETRYMPSGEAVCNFSVATSERWKDKTTGEAKESTEWHRVTAWGRQAEIVGEYLRKGSLVYIEGKLETRKYRANDGTEKASTEIRMQDMKMLGGREDNPRQSPAPERPSKAAPPEKKAAQKQTSRAPFDDMDDDIPF